MDRTRTIKETLPVLLLVVLGGALAGSVLAGMEEMLDLIPGLIVIVPAIIDMRGNISTALGSRLGSAFHLGLLHQGLRSDAGKENIKGSLALSFFTSVLFPIFLWLISLFLPFSIGPWQLLTIFMISIFTGVTAAIILITITFLIVASSIKFNIDPDNVSGPVLTTAGDVFTLLVMFGYAHLFYYLFADILGVIG